MSSLYPGALRRLAAFVTLALLVASPLSGAPSATATDGPSLVKSFGAIVTSAGLVASGGALYFVADSPDTGSELWRSDGTPEGTRLVKDINPGAADAFHLGADSSGLPRMLANFGGALYFVADDGAHGYELWRSDGTAEGTQMVKDIVPGATGSFPVTGEGGDTLFPPSLTSMGGALYFVADDGAHGYELWRSDGTAAGTGLLKDVRPGAAGSSPAHLTVVSGALFFLALDGSTSSSVELWRSDGTPAGTLALKGDVADVPPAGANGLLYFSSFDGTHGYELWKSDGTKAGTVLVKDINPGAADSLPETLTGVGGKLYFTAFNEKDGNALWRSDGTGQGTALVRAGLASELAGINGTLFFQLFDSTHGGELWRSDGTPAGTALVKDINLGPDGSSPSSLTGVGTQVYFTAYDAAHGAELWKSDGTAAGTALVEDLNPGAGSSDPMKLTEVRGALYYVSADGAQGFGLRRLLTPFSNLRPASYLPLVRR